MDVKIIIGRYKKFSILFKMKNITFLIIIGLDIGLHILLSNQTFF